MKNVYLHVWISKACGGADVNKPMFLILQRCRYFTNVNVKSNGCGFIMIFIDVCVHVRKVRLTASFSDFDLSTNAMNSTILSG